MQPNTQETSWITWKKSRCSATYKMLASQDHITHHLRVILRCEVCWFLPILALNLKYDNKKILKIESSSWGEIRSQKITCEARPYYSPSSSHTSIEVYWFLPILVLNLKYDHMKILKLKVVAKGKYYQFFLHPYSSSCIHKLSRSNWN
jgi:hypothetical protein